MNDRRGNVEVHARREEEEKRGRIAKDYQGLQTFTSTCVIA